MSLHQKALSWTRGVIAALALFAIWFSNPVAATISTLLWVYMPVVVRYEETLYKRLKK